jgi:hypothetical protein
MRVRRGGAFGLPRVLLAAVLAMNAGVIPHTQSQTPYTDIRHLFTSLLPDQLPADLRTLSDADRAARWPAWIDSHDRAIRARLRQGDEDTVMLWMALGTSFTTHPRVTDVIAKSPDDGTMLIKVAQARAHDFVAALATRASDDRITFARQLLAERGLRVDDEPARQRAEQYVLQRFGVLLKEQRELAARLRAARGIGDPTAEFAAQSTLFSDRGLSLDTSLPPNLAIGDALKALSDRGLLAPGGIVRAAVIGPGLDFADKDEGFDFYPPQTVQPFALFETLLRLGLADRDRLQITAFDLSPRIQQHLAAARERAQRGAPYPIVLALDSRSWTGETTRYWKEFGTAIGKPVSGVAAPAGLRVQTRGVQVVPEIVLRITPVDLDIVTQRAGGDPFDLIIATNVLVYYGVFEQALALANIESMLRPGGILLTNTALPELPGSAMRSAGYSTTAYSDQPGDGDHVVWYRRVKQGSVPALVRR